MFRKILLTSAFIAGALQAYAQLTPSYTYNALLFSSQYYDGTARSLAMGNAMTALGGDLGALSYNPAASGIYYYTEFTMTPSLYSSISHNSFLGNKSSSSRNRFALSNIGWVGSFETGRTRGLLNFNLAITANQTNNFAFRSSGSGIQNSSSYLGSLAATMPAINSELITMQDDYDERPFYRGDVSWSQVLAWNTGLMDYLDGNTDRVCTVYNHFHSMGRQVPMQEQVLPFKDESLENQGREAVRDYILEPDSDALLEVMIPSEVRIRLYRTLLDSITAENAARMIAMQTATDNAQELIDELSLEYNKRRQQAITDELADITQSN